MGERTATEVLAEKMKAISDDLQISADPKLYQRIAVRLAEDPAITVRTDMVVERFVVEFHYGGILVSTAGYALHAPEDVKRVLTSTDAYHESLDHRIVVRPYPEATDG
jgi:hypothetical protein